MARSSYDNPLEVTYGFGSYVFTVAFSNTLKPPRKCNRASLIDISVLATVLFTAVTTAALINLGTAGTATKYAQLALGTLAAGASANLNTAPNAGVITITSNMIDLVTDAIPGGPTLAIVAPTGGSPAGTGILNVSLAWS